MAEIRDKMNRISMSQKELAEAISKELGLDHTIISDILKEEDVKGYKRRLYYSEAKMILDKLNGFLSALPEEKAYAKATKRPEKVHWTELDSPLSKVAFEMYDTGISQFPVLDGNRIVGTLSEKVFLRYLLHPPTSEKKWMMERKLDKREGWLNRKGWRASWIRGEKVTLDNLKVRDLLKYLERTPEYRQDIPLSHLGPELEHCYAVFLRDGATNIEDTAVFTRADILKLFFDNSMIRPKPDN